MVLIFGSAAIADDGVPGQWDSEPPQIASSQEGLTPVGFDPDIAVANGADVRYRFDGSPYLAEYPDLPAMDAEALLTGDSDQPTPIGGQLVGLHSNGMTPDDVLPGNCGSSYIFIYDLGNRRYRVDTGFQTDQPSVGYTWSANVIHPTRRTTTHIDGTVSSR